MRWIQVGTNAVDRQKLTLDDVVMLSQKGNVLYYISLSVYNEAEDSIDIRTEDVSAFIAVHRNDVPKVDVPEYQLIAADSICRRSLPDTTTAAIFFLFVLQTFVGAGPPASASCLTG